MTTRIAEVVKGLVQTKNHPIALSWEKYPEEEKKKEEIPDSNKEAPRRSERTKRPPTKIVNDFL